MAKTVPKKIKRGGFIALAALAVLLALAFAAYASPAPALALAASVDTLTPEQNYAPAAKDPVDRIAFDLAASRASPVALGGASGKVLAMKRLYVKTGLGALAAYDKEVLAHATTIVGGGGGSFHMISALG